ncbi:hypothetical protein ACH4U5_09075 [Streptomyces sp. NPDC020858]|uniref:hypothetical protein n=1 Tax=Streptomyces sp. NPDC020858 TaxID=3365097 RepID=UPI003795B468
MLHASEYRNPEAFTGERVIVVGAGDAAVQMAVELASVARVTLASHRVPPRPAVSRRPRRLWQPRAPAASRRLLRCA